MGRLPWQPGYTGLGSAPSSEDGLLTLRAGANSGPPGMIQTDDGVWTTNPIASVFKQRREAAGETEREAADAEQQELIASLGKAKRAKDYAWDQELAQRSAADAARSDAESQAIAAQRTMRPSGGLGFPRGGRGRQRPGRK